MRDNLTERIVSLLTELEEQREFFSEVAVSLRESSRAKNLPDSYTNIYSKITLWRASNAATTEG